MTGKQISDFITFPQTFEKFRWYKPILIFIIGIILVLIFQEMLTGIFYNIFGASVMNPLLNGGYESLTNAVAELFSDLCVIIMIPALYIAVKIIRDRPFSSYITSRGGWNFKLYLKALVIPLISFIIFNAVDAAVNGPAGTYNFTLTYLIVAIIFCPLQCIAEELVFRGLVMQTFGSWFKIPILAVILQAIVFALAHGYNTYGLVEIFFSGMVFGFLTWKTNGIEVSSALHTANNFSITLFVMLGIISPTSSPTLVDTATSIVFVILLGILMYYIGRRTGWYGEIPE